VICSGSSFKVGRQRTIASSASCNPSDSTSRPGCRRRRGQRRSACSGQTPARRRARRGSSGVRMRAATGYPPGEAEEVPGGCARLDWAVRPSGAPRPRRHWFARSGADATDSPAPYRSGNTLRMAGQSPISLGDSPDTSLCRQSGIYGDGLLRDAKPDPGLPGMRVPGGCPHRSGGATVPAGPGSGRSAPPPGPPSQTPRSQLGGGESSRHPNVG